MHTPPLHTRNSIEEGGERGCGAPFSRVHTPPKSTTKTRPTRLPVVSRWWNTSLHEATIYSKHISANACSPSPSVIVFFTTINPFAEPPIVLYTVNPSVCTVVFVARHTRGQFSFPGWDTRIFIPLLPEPSQPRSPVAYTLRQDVAYSTLQ